MCTGFGWLELISFIVAGMGLCFGFVTKAVLVTHQYFSYQWAEGTQEAGRWHSWDHWPKLIRGTSLWHYMTTRSARKAGGVEFARAVIAWGLAGHQSASGEQLWDFFWLWCGGFKIFIITWFSWFCFSLFPFLPIKLSLPQPISFLTLPFWFFPSAP